MAVPMTETTTIAKTAQHGSIASLIDIAFPEDTNHHGTLIGGTGLVERAGRSSMSIETKFRSENPLTGNWHNTVTRHFRMVAVCKDHRPASVHGRGATGAVPLEQRRA
jgi:acyl-CoA hydrolase